jgi:hypothetical protein
VVTHRSADTVVKQGGTSYVYVIDGIDGAFPKPGLEVLAGEVSGFAPPRRHPPRAQHRRDNGDFDPHLRTDITRIGSSARRYYD